MSDNNFSDLDNYEREEEKKRRSEAIKKSKQKRNTVLFMIASSLIQIAITLLLMLTIYIVSILVVYKLLNFQSPIIIQFLSPVAFIGGIVLGFILHKKLMRFIVHKFNLFEKLQPGLTDYYLTKKELKEKQYKR